MRRVRAAAEGDSAIETLRAELIANRDQIEPQLRGMRDMVNDPHNEDTIAVLNEQIGILPWSPLGGGWLTGKYQRDRAPTGATRLGEDPERGMEAYGRRNPEERTWRVIDAVRSVAEARGASMAQVALAWLVDRPAVTSVILGARTLEQLEDNLGAAGLTGCPLGSSCRAAARARRIAPSAAAPSGGAEADDHLIGGQHRPEANGQSRDERVEGGTPAFYPAARRVPATCLRSRPMLYRPSPEGTHS